MKKAFMIALCCIALSFTACNKPETDDTDYTPNYVGTYVGPFTFTFTEMHMGDQVLPGGTQYMIDDICMIITKGTTDNAVIATVTVDNETRETVGTAKADKADFDVVHLTVDKPDQGYRCELDMKMEGVKGDDGVLNITGTFTGEGVFNWLGTEYIIDEAKGTLVGNLVKQ